MPNKDKNIPKRRFKAFENADAWELRKLGEVVSELKSGLSRELSSTDIGLPVVRANNISDNQLNLEKDIKYWYQNDPQGSDTSVYFIEQNDILVNFINSEAKMGTAAIVKNSPSRPTIYTTNILRMRCTNDLIPYFFLYYTNLDCYKNFIKGITKIAVNQASFTTVDYKKYELFVPEVDEQSTIGTFFATLDRQITLHQRKLDKLKHVKQAYLSEMFPAEGERVPKRRFPGFTDAWELRKLGEVVYRSNITSSSKVLPRLEFEDINSGLGTLNKDIFQKVNDDRKGLEFNEGDVLFGKLRPYLKNWWYAEFNGIALGDFWNLKSDVWHSCFLYTYIQSNAFQLVANDTSGTKMPRSDWNLVAESIAKFPTLPEQKAIGTFFSTLDQQITLHQRKLEKLKNLKKALLNELFV